MALEDPSVFSFIRLVLSTATTSITFGLDLYRRIQVVDEFKNKEIGTMKILKKHQDDVQIHPSKQEVFTVEAHSPPTTQYTRVVQGMTKYKVIKYKEGDMVWMWDTQKGEPTNVKGSTQSWLRPFKLGMESVNDSYYLSTLEGRRRPLPISRLLLKPHQGGGT
jgi:hypothetical protein